MKLYTDPRFRKDWTMCCRFIELKWIMNPGTTLKRKGSLQDDLLQLEQWFCLKNRNRRSK
jgi:hypothetical protein